MAYAALASLSQTIDLILRYHQDPNFSQFENQIESIQKPVKSLQRFLEDSPDTGSWLEGRITEATHEAEDVVEMLSSVQIYGSSVGPSRFKFKHQLPEREYCFHDLEKVTRIIESINQELTATNNFFKDHLLGECLDIKSRVFGERSDLEVIPILGMGGIGKTSLARRVYDDRLVMEHFDIRGWATVSQDKGAAKIISELLVSMGHSNAGGSSGNFIKMYTTLLERRYLVVLDDIRDRKAWDDLRMMFPDDGNGSRIIVTTRLEDLASYVDYAAPVCMSLMDKDQSWRLLRQKVFKGDTCPPNLVHIGRRIAGLCRGLPLLTVLVSGVLAANVTAAAWLAEAERLTDNHGGDEILSMSYAHLPHHLRPCFLYMAAFPEDHEICVSMLIKLWVAEGFLEPNESESFEEIGEEYLEELVERSLVSVTKRKSCGRIKCVSVHDLVREICLRKAQEEDFFGPATQFLEEGKKIPRRLTVLSSCDLSSLSSSRIRTIVCLKNIELQCSFQYFRLLRILDLSNACPSFPAEIFQLIHLRCLAFDGLFNLPAAISNLRNLQTLIISSSNIVELPVEIWGMPQLRHIVVLSCVVPSVEGATFALENLLTLCNAVNHICSEEFLKIIPNLKKLGLIYTAWSDCEDDYQLHNLIHLQALENLKIQVSNFPEKQQRVSPAYPVALRKLSLSGLGLPWSDMKIVGSLPNLEVLKLRNDACIGDTWETTKGEFSRLTVLLIDKSDPEDWISEYSHFPRLKSLVLRRCWNLSEIPEDIGFIPTLKLIEVDDENNLLVDSAKKIQERQQRYGNYGLRIFILRNSEHDE